MSPLGLEMEADPTDRASTRSNKQSRLEEDAVASGASGGAAAVSGHQAYANGHGFASHDEEGRFGGLQDENEDDDEAIGLLGDSTKSRCAGGQAC